MCIMNLDDSRRAIAEVLTTKRKPRELKACYPCRQRKVKCNNEMPCEGCVRREHPELCMMLGPSKRSRTETPKLGFSSVNVDQETKGLSSGALEALLAKVTAIESSLDSLKKDIKDILRIQAEHPATPNTPFANHLSSPAVSSPYSALSETATLSRPQAAQDPRNSVPIGQHQDWHPSPTQHGSYSVPIPHSPPPRRKSSIPSGIHAPEDVTGGTVYLGSNSEPAFLLTQHARSGPSSSLHKNLLQIFGLHNSNATYPFANLWGSSGTELDIQKVCSTLPSSEETLRYFERYRENAWPFYPAIVDIEEFESAVCDFVQERADLEANGGRGDVSCGKSPSWFGLLFAVLACGMQFSETPVVERELSSRVYICCSFQCLRIANIFIHPTVEQIQALLLLGSCIRNDTNPGAAWILLGITIRLAQSIGLHRGSHEDGEKAIKSMKLWWAIVWQDSLLSFSYDRPPGATGADFTIPSSSGCPSNLDNPKTFVDAIYSLCRVIRDLTSAISQPEGAAPISIPAILHFKARLETILRCSSVMGVNGRGTRQTRLEALALRIHVGYCIAQLCRFALRHGSNLSLSNPETTTQQQHFTSECVLRSTDVVLAFLDMVRLSAVVCRSWAFMHNALSCALLLKILTPREASSVQLLARMVSVLQSQEKAGGGKPYAVVLAALKGADNLAGGCECPRHPNPDCNDCGGVQQDMSSTVGVVGGSREAVHGHGNYEGFDGQSEGLFDSLSPASRILEDIVWGGAGGSSYQQDQYGAV